MKRESVNPNGIELKSALRQAAKVLIKKHGNVDKALLAYAMNEGEYATYLLGYFESNGVDVRQAIFEAGE